MAEIKSFKFSNKSLFLFAIIFALVGGYTIWRSFALGACVLSTPSSSVSERRVKLNIAGCAGTQFYTVSESADFGISNGVKVQITDVASDRTHADLSVTYPSGTTGGNATPFSIPAEQRQIKMLAVLFTFEDNNGQIAGLGNYETTKWLQRLAFGDGVVGFDGYFKNYSIKDYIFQSSNGSVNLTGEVYPQIIRLPLEKYRQFLGATGNMEAPFNEDILKAIERANPGYLAAHNFDILLGLSSEQYSTFRSLYEFSTDRIKAGEFGSIKRSLTYAIPVDRSKSILWQTLQENRTSYDASKVITRYNPQTVEGVWLASDTSRSGTNYYTGGSTVMSTSTRYTHIQLGTPLPDSNSQVIVRYKAAIASSYDQTTTDQALADSWYPHFMHELQHEISQLPAYTFTQRNHIGDLYLQPSNVRSYDLMDSGNDMATHPFYNKNYNEPSLLSGYNKLMLGYARPYTLKYSENDSSVRIYKSENGDPAKTSSNTLIKIPLRPIGDVGLETRIVGSTTRQYRGDEYLLLEWRYKGDLENEMHNFDRNLPSEGLIIYHIIEADPYELTGHSRDVSRIMDATPDKSDFTDVTSDTAGSSALFGPQSGVLDYTSSSFWQEKVATNDTHSFEYLVSPGSGSKTLYAKFADANGTITGTQQINIDLTTDQVPIDRLPTMTFDLADGTVLTSFKNIYANYIAPNGAKNIRFYVDDVLKGERTETVISPTSESHFIRPTDYKPGEHRLKAVFYDGAMNKISKTVTFVIATSAGDSSAPSVSLTSPSAGSTVFGSSVDVSANATDNVSMAKVEFYIDGSLKSTDTTALYSYNWDTTWIPNGSHIILARAFDVAGNSSTSQLSVNVNNNGIPPPPDPTPLTVSITSPLNGSVVAGTVNVIAGASDNVSVARVEFYVNGTLANSDPAAPYSFAWNSASVSNGLHNLSAKAYDTTGNSSTDQISVSVNNGDATPPSTPTNLSAVASAYNRVNLSWTASSDNVGVAGYYIVRGGATIAQTSGTGTSYADTTVNASTGYSYQVMAYDAKGNTSGLSNTGAVTTPATPDSQAPNAPTSLTATSVSNSQINLSWTASSDNVGVTGYDIYRNNTKITTVSTTSFGNTDLAANTTYSYYVITKDAAGNSSPASNTASATTQSAVVTTGNINGTVSSSKGGTVPGATIVISFGGSRHSYSTSTTGSYLISDVPAGNYSVKYSKQLFNAATINVSVTANQTITKNVTLVSKK